MVFDETLFWTSSMSLSKTKVKSRTKADVDGLLTSVSLVNCEFDMIFSVARISLSPFDSEANPRQYQFFVLCKQRDWMKVNGESHTNRNDQQSVFAKALGYVTASTCGGKGLKGVLGFEVFETIGLKRFELFFSHIHASIQRLLHFAWFGAWWIVPQK